MAYEHEKLARILRTKPEVLIDLERKLDAFTGKHGVMADIVKENDVIVQMTLNELGLAHADQTAENVSKILIKRLEQVDADLYEFLDKPDLSKMSHVCAKLCEIAAALHEPQKGFFLKRERAQAMLRMLPPQNMLAHFQCKDIDELCAREDFTSVFSALRFVESEAWMHNFFETAYSALTQDDFEERDVELKVLEPQWLSVAQKFLKHKFHNVSHLKELGIIFIIPLPIDAKGDTLRLFMLILHYLNEMHFYANLFKRFSPDADFPAKFKSLLRGDVSESRLADGDQLNFRIVQRYLAKDDMNDFRLFEPHVNPEAEHWYRAEHDFARVPSLMKKEGHSLGYWQGLDFVGDFFKYGFGELKGREALVSFDLIDLTMSLVNKGTVKYLYHHQEALWNKIFIDYLSPERFHKLIEDNIIKGYITL